MNFYEEFQTTKPVGPEELAEYTQKLIDHAAAGKHDPLVLIKNFREFRVMFTLNAAICNLANGFRTTALSQYTEYVRAQQRGMDNFSLLLKHVTYRECADFYREEQAITLESIKEYIAYLFHGHFFSALAGKERAEEDLHDFRRNKRRQ